MQIRCYPLDFEYRVKDDQVYVLLYSKLEDGQKICVFHRHKPYFYVRLRNIDPGLFRQRVQNLALPVMETPARVLACEEVEKELRGKKETFWKIYVNYPKAVPPLAKELESWGVECYERDILFVHRYLRDVGITPMTLVQAEGEFIKNPELRIPAFMAHEVTQLSKDAVQSVKILAIDLETYAERREINPRKNPILMIGLYGIDAPGKEFQKVLTWKKFTHKLDYVEHLGDEIELLERFRHLVQEYQPDIITGYNSDGFDFPYLKTRAEKYNLVLDLGVDRSDIIASSGGFGAEEGKIKGMVHLDAYKFIRNIFGKDLKTESFSLDAVARELLGHSKHGVNVNELAHIWDSQPEKLPDFCAYNLHDAHLAFKLCQLLLSDMIEFTKIIGLPTADVIRMRFSRLVESYILKRAGEYHVLAPNKPSGYELEDRREESIQGGYVFEPTPGLYENIVVFDFRSLYPTIITAHNIGPEGFRCSCCPEQERVPGHPDYWFCQKEKKFLPSILEQLILRRVDLKRLIKEEKEKGNNTQMLEARSYALKILANSFYGYLGFYGARWYCLECAASTTAYARNYIQSTIRQAEQKGFTVIYADTDSCFILLKDKILDQAMEFMNEINFDLPGHMELECEGYYPKGIFVAHKSTERGAKKKYALLNEAGQLKIVGFETVRRNWSPIAKEVQEEVLKRILAGKREEALSYVREMVQKLREGKINLQQLIIKTQITRELSKYTAQGPHVAVAQKLKTQGVPIVPGIVIEYIVARGAGLVRERAKLPHEIEPGGYDAEYYVNNQILPAVSSIFAVLGYDGEGILAGTSQTGLGQFFTKYSK